MCQSDTGKMHISRHLLSKTHHNLSWQANRQLQPYILLLKRIMHIKCSEAHFSKKRRQRDHTLYHQVCGECTKKTIFRWKKVSLIIKLFEVSEAQHMKTSQQTHVIEGKVTHRTSVRWISDIAYLTGNIGSQISYSHSTVSVVVV